MLVTLSDGRSRSVGCRLFPVFCPTTSVRVRPDCPSFFARVPADSFSLFQDMDPYLSSGVSESELGSLVSKAICFFLPLLGIVAAG